MPVPGRLVAAPWKQSAAALLLFCLSTMTAVAAEPYLDFLSGLRNQGYHDAALWYLDQMAARPGLPADVRVVLPFERGQVLLASAADASIGPDLQRQRLDAAQSAFDEFTRSQPDHPLAARALGERAKILLSRARVDLWEINRVENVAEKNASLQTLRTNLQQARSIFQRSQSQSQQKLLTFPSPIPASDTAQLQERSQVENQLLSSGLDAVQCLYLEAQASEAGSTQRKELLAKAAVEFDQFRQQHRSTLAGLYAAVWQGKCFEEQGEFRTALGLYQEVLENVRSDDGNASALRLRDLALHYTFICLNDSSQNRQADVVQRAEDWLKSARDRARTEEGVGIQWELGRAHEALGADRQLSESARQNHLTQAMNSARLVNRFPGEFKQLSGQMIQRLNVALGRKLDVPTDFDGAFTTASQLYDQITQLKEGIQAAQAAGKLDQVRQQLATQAAAAAEMTRMDEIAVRLAVPATDATQLNTAWLRLCYGYVLQQRLLDATALADYLITRFAEKSPELALEAAFIGATALQESARDLPAGSLNFEIGQAERLTRQLTVRWPDSDRTHDCRNVLARLQLQQGDPLAAAATWGSVPASSAKYPSTQARAGLATWRQYVEQVNRPTEGRPPESQLAEWKAQAIALLERGLAAADKAYSDRAPFPADLVQGKLTLAGIRNLDGIYQTQGEGPQGALQLLTTGPHAVISAVTIGPGETRPVAPEDPKSRQTANLAYRQLLRTHIGLRNLDEARAARAKLEEVAGGGDEAALTEVFVQFGRQLQDELTRLRDSGQTQRLQDVRSGFESFLNDLFQRNEGQTFTSLLWIAETYSSLATATSDQPDKAGAFFNKASATYQSILDQSAARKDFATPQQVVACKLRMVSCLREQKNFPKAEAVMRDVLTVYPNAPNVQFEAAQLYQDWGSAGGAEAHAKFGIALYGRKATPPVWGWAYAAQSLRRALQSKPDPQLEQMHYDARFHQADGERAFAKVLKDPAESRDHLQKALNAIVSFQRTSARWPDLEYQRFNLLYQSLQRELGIPVSPLPREFTPSTVAQANNLAPVANGQQAQPVAVPVPVAPIPEPAPAAPPSGGNVLVIALILIVGLAGTAAVILFTRKKPRGKSSKRPYTSGGAGSARALNLDAAEFPGLPDEKKTRPGKPAARPAASTFSLNPTAPPAASPPTAARPRKPAPPS